MVENNSQSDSRVIKDRTQSGSELTSQGHGTQGQGQGEIPRKPPAVTSTPTDVTSPVDRQQARMEAQADRQRIKEEAERGQAVAMTNRDLDNVFPEDRFTLMSAEPDVLDYE